MIVVERWMVEVRLKAARKSWDRIGSDRFHVHGKYIWAFAIVLVIRGVRGGSGAGCSITWIDRTSSGM